MPQRHPESIGNMDHHLPNRWVAMHVLVRVEMRGVPPDQVTKRLELAIDLCFDPGSVTWIDHPVARHPTAAIRNPFAQVDVQAQAQQRPLYRQARSRPRLGESNHEAGACHDAMIVRRGDAPVDPWALPEVVGIDDDVAMLADDLRSSLCGRLLGRELRLRVWGIAITGLSQAGV